MTAARVRGEPRPFSVAPMMDRTDRHYRWLMRTITRRALLYTPMIAARRLLASDGAALLEHDPREQPLAVQLGGADPRELAQAARIAVDCGAVEVNLNCGCPSPAATAATWGAALMLQPARVAEAVAAMRAAVAVPVTVKHRLGVRGHDGAEALFDFVDTVAAAGCDRFVVHARAAVLGGLGTRKNRSVPPLRPAEVYALAHARPALAIEMNGGIVDLDGALAHLRAAPLAGVMIGRAAYDDPFAWADVDALVAGDRRPPPSRAECGAMVLDYVAAHVQAGGRAHDVVRHALGLWRGVPGGRRVRGELAHAELDLATLSRAVACLRLAEGTVAIAHAASPCAP
ncbi:MAG TPA: tRNA dihydrouridine(20/20a) synthase DusA [Nannocystaceae bacterium]|nr:tRNA dihydrouridine(20/20a) synthase DusA [Nannocystaceae bacterium]